MVRVTVNLPEAAKAVPEIKRRMIGAGVEAPLIGDFHYNGHLLLTQVPGAPELLTKYRINPGNVGHGARRDEQFPTICTIAEDQDKAVRIGVNAGSLDQLLARFQDSRRKRTGIGEDFRGGHRRVHGALGGPVHGTRPRLRA